MRKVFFTEIRLWLVQIGIPAALIYLYIRSNPNLSENIHHDLHSIINMIKRR